MHNQIWSIGFLTPPTPLTIPHWLPAFLESLMLLKNWCSIHARYSKSSLKHSMRFCDIFPTLKQNLLYSKVSGYIFEIDQLWQSGFSRVYSNCCCSCSFEAEIIKSGQSSHKMYSNDILNFQESTTILNAYMKKVWKLIVCTSYINWSINLLFNEEIATSWLKRMNFVLSAFTVRSMPLAASSRLYSRDSVWASVFARSARSSV